MRNGFPLVRSLVVVCLVLGSSALATTISDTRLPAPVAISPGDAVGSKRTDQRCPTFSWGAITGAHGYELAVYQGGSGATDTEPVPVLRVDVPAAATAYTPDLERCLEAGASYGWLVRARTAKGSSPWSQAMLFEVERDQVAQLHEVVAELRSRLQKAEALVSERAAPRVRRAPAGPSSDSAARRGHPVESALAGPGSRALTSDTTGSGVVRRVSAASPDPDDPSSLTLSSGLEFVNDALIVADEQLLLWTDQAFNLALGPNALRHLSSGGSNNVAFGKEALYSLDTGLNNVAIGNFALANLDGDDLGNIAIGTSAGSFLLAGDSNIFIGNLGGVYETATIRLGSSQTRAFIAGDLGLGHGNNTVSPQNRLHVKESVSADGSDPANYVAQIENTATDNQADVLALTLGRDHVDDTNPLSTANNLITFFDGGNADRVLGRIHATITGGVALTSGDADFAEWLPRLDPAEALEPGEVVGLRGNALTKDTAGAARVFVVSTSPLVNGNYPGDARSGDWAPVAFLGQAPVKVRGVVHVGDLLVASGRDDGYAVARSPGKIAKRDERLVVGQALETVAGEGEHHVRALVGVGIGCSARAFR